MCLDPVESQSEVVSGKACESILLGVHTLNSLHDVKTGAKPS